MDKFCEGCGIKLKKNNPLSEMFIENDFEEFSDGLYCKDCARERKGKIKPKK